MYWSQFVFAVGLALTLALSCVSAGIRCYHCDSRYQISCKNGDDFDKSENLRDQDEFGNDCEYCTTATYKIMGRKVVQRRCEIATFDKERYGLRGSKDCAPSWFYSIEGEICMCNKNKCNSGGTAVVVSLVTLVTSLMLSKLFS